MRYNVEFVYTDYANDEEPELSYYEVDAESEETAIKRVQALFQPIDIVNITVKED